MKECSISHSYAPTSTRSPNGLPRAAATCRSTVSANSISKRRAAITEAEQLKAHKNAESAEDRPAQAQRRRYHASCRRRSAKSATRSPRSTRSWRRWIRSSRNCWPGIPNLPHESVPVGRSAEDNVEVRRARHASAVRFRAEGALGSGAGTRHSGFRSRRQNHRRAFRALLGPGREARARADQFLAGHAHARARVHGSAAAVHGEFGQPLRHRPAAEVRGRSVQDARSTISG